ncbi:MAG: DUF3179 domain-containing protein [Alphaproteobacteria bacterium]|nr:DUF3179 domain-containing protein [Alphaproteobacteria bacterium]
MKSSHLMIALMLGLAVQGGASPQALAQGLTFGCAERIGRFCLSQARAEFSTDFSRAAIDLGEIRSGGPPKDGIPAIDDPVFVSVGDIDDIAPNEPVVGLHINGEWRAYPLRVLMWHEIANDTIGGVPVAATFCPLCNAVIVFDRRLDGRVLDFGTTGRLRHSDLIMYDRQTETWWQQFTGTAIVGELVGSELDILPARLESFAQFVERAPASARVLIPANSNLRSYGANPYEGYDSASFPFLYDGDVPDGIAPLDRVVSLADKREAWALSLLREKGRIETADGVVLTWTPGQSSALDTYRIEAGRDVGTVIASKDGQDVPYFVDFAFAFHAFRPDATIHIK